MNLSLLDISIILVYLLATVIIGFVMKKQASKISRPIFLGEIHYHGTCSVSRMLRDV